MKILYIHQYFSTPKQSSALRSYNISMAMLKAGHQVTMVTASNDPNAKSVSRCNEDGIDVIYVNNPYSQYFSKIKKVWSFVKFVYKSIKVASKEKDVDIVYATSTPLTIGFVALFLYWYKGWRYVFEVRDLWPEFPIQVGAIRNKAMIWILRKLEKKIYDKAEHVVALSPGMAEGVLKTGQPQSKVSMIPNMSKPDAVFPHDVPEDAWAKYGIDPTKFNICHVGSMGVANGLTYITDAAEILKQKGINDIHFIMVGDGATKPMLTKIVDEKGLDNVRFIGKFGFYDIKEILNCCDMSITCFKNLPILYTNSPNKLFDSLAAALPIIVNSAGWTKDLVEREDCGFYAEVDNPKDLADKLICYKDDKETLKRWGQNARRLSETTYSRKILSQKVVDVVSSLTLT